MEDVFVDFAKVCAASGLGRYKGNGRTTYGVLNIKVGDRVHAYDFCKDFRGNLSVNIRKSPRNTKNTFMTWFPDFKGFIIRKDGLCVRLKRKQAKGREVRQFAQKTEGWHTYALALRDYMEALA